jgi:hypothetical protein
MVGLEVAELTHEGVVPGVVDLGIVEQVVALVVVRDHGPELGGPSYRVVAPGPCRVAHATTPEPITRSGRAGSYKAIV